MNVLKKTIIALIIILSTITIKAQLSIAYVETIYTLCDVKANIVVTGVTPENMGDVQYLLEDANGNPISGWESYSSFIVEKGKTYTVWVKYESSSATKRFTVENKAVDVGLDGLITNIDCDHNKGEIDVNLIGGYRYLKFSKPEDYVMFSKPVFDNNSIKDFTVTVLVRLEDTSDELRSRGTIGLIGQDNTLEFGFREGAPSFYLHTNNGAVDHQTSIKKIDDDHKWHQLVIRGNGTKVEMLVDGNIWFTTNKTYNNLSSDAAGNSAISIGAKVWATDNNGIEGDIGRATFWKKYLSDVELSQLRQNSLLFTTDDCLAAYDMSQRVNGSLVAEKGENGIFASRSGGTGITWSDGVSSTWYNKSDLSTPIATTEDALNLDAGEYKVVVVYDPRDCDILTLEHEYSIVDNKNISTTLTGGESTCVGEQITLTASVVGGSILPSTRNTYAWQKWDGIQWVYVIAPQYINTYNPEVSTLSATRYRAEVRSNLCISITSEKSVTVHKKIKTNSINKD